jgi:hypothetical protein
VTIRAAAISSLLVAGISMVHPASTWLRDRGVPVPHAHLTPSVWLVAGIFLFTFVAVFVVAEVFLLFKAITTVENPELHERYKELMLHWPYALLTPYTIFKTNVLPRVFFGSDERRSTDPPPTGAHRAGSQQVARPNQPTCIEPTAAAEEPAPLMIDQYRSALALVIGQIDSLTTDSELRDLLLEKYRSLESAAEGRSPVTGHMVPPRVPKAL